MKRINLNTQNRTEKHVIRKQTPPEGIDLISIERGGGGGGDEEVNKKRTRRHNQCIVESCPSYTARAEVSWPPSNSGQEAAAAVQETDHKEEEAPSTS